MNREDIIRMANEAGFTNPEKLVTEDKQLQEILLGFWENLEAFAALVASAERERIKQANAPEIERINARIKELEDAVITEREACAEIAEKQRYAMHISLTSNPVQNGTAVGIANAIRARGQA